MNKPTIKTKVQHRGVKFILLGYRKLTQNEIKSVLTDIYSKRRPKKGELITYETIFGFDD